jgi:anthranilate synthase/aminodeoxychorismate synthase-like glutamine amidotransferase
MILIIDNYDSFTYNIVQYIGSLGFQMEVHRNDKIAIDEINSSISHIIVSPGPCTPDDAGISVEIIQNYHDKIPILGICLGHQAIGQAFGSKIVKAKILMHGKTDLIEHRGSPIFKKIDTEFIATRYHSLIIEEESLASDLQIDARSKNDNYIMSVSHKTSPTYGIQFHPESIETPNGIQILENFLNI